MNTRLRGTRLEPCLRGGETITGSPRCQPSFLQRSRQRVASTRRLPSASMASCARGAATKAVNAAGATRMVRSTARTARTFEWFESSGSRSTMSWPSRQAAATTGWRFVRTEPLSRGVQGLSSTGRRVRPSCRLRLQAVLSRSTRAMCTHTSRRRPRRSTATQTGPSIASSLRSSKAPTPTATARSMRARRSMYRVTTRRFRRRSTRFPQASRARSSSLRAPTTSRSR